MSKVILMEGHLGSLINTPTFSNVKSDLNHCRRQGMRTREGQAGGNMCRGGQRKENSMGIERKDWHGQSWRQAVCGHYRGQ